MCGGRRSGVLGIGVEVCVGVGEGVEGGLEVQ